MSEQSMERVYLTVPFMEKDRAKEAAKQAGFRIYWDKKSTQWFAPANEDLSPLSRWLPKEQGDANEETEPDPVAEFSQALSEAGLALARPPIMDGQLRRVPVADGATGNLDGAYIGHLDGHPAGFIQNHKTGLKTNWKASRRPAEPLASVSNDTQATETLSPEEQSARFEGLLEKLAAPSAHPYTSKKEITLDAAIRVTSSNQLAIPVYSHPRSRGGRVVGIQYIAEDGAKRFARGSRKKGAMFLIGEPAIAAEPTVVLVAEGYATAQTLNDAVSLPVAVAFDAGNLRPVAQNLSESYPDAAIMLCADDDSAKDVNVGLTAAADAAKELNVGVITPTFDSKNTGTDFNDLAAHRSQISNGLKSYGLDF